MSDLTQAVRRMIRNHRGSFVLAIVAAAVATCATVGLIAWIGDYALGLLGLTILFSVAVVALRQEQRGRRLQSGVDRVEQSLKDVVSALTPLQKQAHDQGDGLKALQRSLAVVELTTVDSAKAVERLKATLDADTP